MVLLLNILQMMEMTLCQLPVTANIVRAMQYCCLALPEKSVPEDM